jgi:hypothetical protein
MKTALILMCMVLAGCDVPSNGVTTTHSHVDHELYARVFNQCVKDAGSDHAFEQDNIAQCAVSAKMIATIPDSPEVKQ